MKYINKISNHAYTYREAELKNEELKGFHQACLMVICNHPGFSQKEIAKRMLVNKSTITRWLTCLENKGYITRKTDGENKRITRVYPTDFALEIRPEIDRVFNEWENCILEDFSDEEKEILFDMLKRILEKSMKKTNVIDGEEF